MIKVNRDRSEFYRGTFIEDQASDMVPVSITASEVSIPGLYLMHDFISAKRRRGLGTVLQKEGFNTMVMSFVMILGALTQGIA
ncbi:hypothetical protein ACSQ67_008769 [Phaseolus vulgaris]